jgi:hypothetical protein
LLVLRHAARLSNLCRAQQAPNYKNPVFFAQFLAKVLQ